MNGRTIGENIARRGRVQRRRDRSARAPLAVRRRLAVLRGNLAPEGAVIKSSAAEPRLLTHTGPAVVFRNYADLAARIDDPDLPVTADSVLVLQHAGPQGGPGMPEWGMLPIPKKLLQQGVRDMVRVSDARMSGTGYGACVLHVSPGIVRRRAAGAGPGRRSDRAGRAGAAADAAGGRRGTGRRRAAWTPAPPVYPRGYGLLFMRHVTQAHEGCDFDFLHRGGVDARAGDSLNWYERLTHIPMTRRMAAFARRVGCVLCFAPVVMAAACINRAPLPDATENAALTCRDVQSLDGPDPVAVTWIVRPDADGAARSMRGVVASARPSIWRLTPDRVQRLTAQPRSSAERQRRRGRSRCARARPAGRPSLGRAAGRPLRAAAAGGAAHRLHRSGRRCGSEGARRLVRSAQPVDVVAFAREAGLSLFYLPSMRNGLGAEDGKEDRGNAILSTLPLTELRALELPFVRQRALSPLPCWAVATGRSHHRRVGAPRSIRRR